MTELILAAQAQQGAGGGWGFIVMMVLIFAIMWWFMIRPQQKRQKEIRKFQNALRHEGRHRRWYLWYSETHRQCLQHR